MKPIFIPFGILPVLAAVACCSCAPKPCGEERSVQLVVLDPGHFHASLLQKNSLEGISDTVRVYAPEGAEVRQYLDAVGAYNGRSENPTSWQEQVYVGDDYLARMLSDRKGDVVVLAGNNRKKTDYILRSVEAGYSVLSDKPLAIRKADFGKLSEAYRSAAEKGLLIYDLMTERYDVLNIITRELLNDRGLFGELQKGTAEDPAVSMRSVHHFFKEVSGRALIRPAWYYDVEQQGEGIADVTTHLIDLVFWQCFPGEAVHCPADVEVTAARHWPTRITLPEFSRSTGAEEFPPYLNRYVRDGALEVLANGSLSYRVKGVHVGMEVVWNYASPDGGDTFSALLKGTKAALEVLQNANTGFVKQLYIRKSPGADPAEFEKRLLEKGAELRRTYPFVTMVKQSPELYWVDVPPENRLGHEAHFSRVAETFLRYLRDGNVPEWEAENTLSKYYITTTAVELAGDEAE